MIYEIDEALRSLIRAEALRGTDVDVVFDAPTKDWAARRNEPTVNLYLYDIREDLRRRQRGLLNEYDGEVVTSRHQPPQHFKLSYLMTAWTQRPEDEHRLLSALLLCFLANQTIPAELLPEPARDATYPVAMTVGLPPPEDRAFADVWSALGGELKPSLDLVVTTPVDGGRRWPAGPPAREGLAVGVASTDGEQADAARRVGGPAAMVPPAGAEPLATGRKGRRAADDAPGLPDGVDVGPFESIFGGPR
ncbi:MAG TPA: DUF4255 domain-containing protein [Frankiaceae bacterium]|nr:DUF4255 domain-containing protein [Frankiaceae bacterium]